MESLLRSMRAIVRITGNLSPVVDNSVHLRHSRGVRHARHAPPPQTHPAGRTLSSFSVMTWGLPTWVHSAARSRHRISTRFRRRASASRTSYTHATCSPTRSMLLSGVDTHLNGLGNMDEWTAPDQWGVDGYEGYLNNRSHFRSCSRIRYVAFIWSASGTWARRLKQIPATQN